MDIIPWHCLASRHGASEDISGEDMLCTSSVLNKVKRNNGMFWNICEHAGKQGKC